ncbi:MFS transporter [bacterium]|nr:MAG: MFS transporter [bacterium]
MKKHSELGLKENWKQFSLLVLVNAFVGGMIGLERSILPELAESEFGLAAKTAILSFIVVFGATKALSNYYAGALAHRWGRKKVLLLGWLFGLPVPFLLIWAPSWNCIVFANVFLGINQGLAWSSTVVMKIDLVGEKQRGFAMGLNEFAGYFSVALSAMATGYLAAQYGVRPVPFYLGIGLSLAGFLTSLIWVKDTIHHVQAEALKSEVPYLKAIFWETTWKHKILGSVTQAGLVNNLNDGMVWGLVPVLLAANSYSLDEIGFVTGLYPAVWGLSQIITGKMGDHYSKKKLLFWGMLIQAFALMGLLMSETKWMYAGIMIFLGIGTALVYPTFLSTIAVNTHPEDRAKSIGIFRLWRDMGYAIGALLTGVIADFVGVPASISFIAILTGLSAFVILFRIPTR